MRSLLDGLLRVGIQRPEPLGLESAVDLEALLLDTTCLKADLHFPVDWVLLRDGVRTLMKAVKLIRREGLKARMEAPEVFLQRINRLWPQMMHSRRQAQSQKARKRVLRGHEVRAGGGGGDRPGLCQPSQHARVARGGDFRRTLSAPSGPIA
jgi:hypothetical protein